ncbi:DUF4365 domain-containing protein [Sinorhizobium fredii]|uniref:DUF4365 domain-containing protein n=1 Tax=Rhizobium fredii TaxID=380 RepID=UPI000568BEFD|nr:DUF4365 domain-containing protein [Sinorhizobium fredii]
MSRIYPRLTTSQLNGLVGYAFVDLYFLKTFNWVLTRVPEGQDNGIDGYLQLYTDDLIQTGRTLGVQVRYGESYFDRSPEGSLYFEGAVRHIGYYQHSTSPVILILAHPDGRIYWKKFEFSEIEITMGKWRTELTASNLLTFEKSRQDLIAIAARPSGNFHLEFQRRYALQAQVRGSDPIYHIVPADDVVNGSVDGIEDFINTISATKHLLKPAMGRLEIYVDYDPGPNIELYEDETFLRWFALVEERRIPWFYFCSKERYDTWLVICLAASIRIQSSTFYQDGVFETGRKLAFEHSDLKRFFFENVNRMQLLVDRGVLSTDEAVHIGRVAHDRLLID